MITVDFKRLDIKPGCRILDAGCGSGRHACEFYRHKDVFVTGVDIKFDDAAKAKQNLIFHDDIGEAGGGAWIVASADITMLPFPDNFFDIAICSEVMEHVPDEKKAVSEIARVLKHGGDMVVSVPRYLPEKICWLLSDEYHGASGGHIRIYKKKRIRSLFAEAGFCERSFHFAHSLHAPYWWLKCLPGPNMDEFFITKLYHRFLVWEMMKKPQVFRLFDFFLNPVMGKSLVLYFKKK